MVHQETETEPMRFEEVRVEPRERRSVSVSIEKLDSGNLGSIQHVFTAQQARKQSEHKLEPSISLNSLALGSVLSVKDKKEANAILQKLNDTIAEAQQSIEQAENNLK